MQVKGGLNNFDFFNWLLNVKNLVLSNGSDNTCKMRSNGIEIAFFFKKLQKSGGFAPRPPNTSGSWGPHPQPPICDIFELHKLSQHDTKVRYLHFSTISSSPLPLQNPSYVQTGNNDFRSSILRYLCPTKTSSLEKF